MVLIQDFALMILGNFKKCMMEETITWQKEINFLDGNLD